MVMILRYTNPEFIETTRQQTMQKPTMYDEFLSHVVSELEDRFVNNPAHKNATALLNLLPSECVKLPDDAVIPPELAEAVSTYDIDLPNPCINVLGHGNKINGFSDPPASHISL